MSKQNKNKSLWPFVVILAGLVLVAAVVIQNLTSDEPEFTATEIVQPIVIAETEYDYQSDKIDGTISVNDAVDGLIIDNNVVESFGEAFAKARSELGTGQVFEWNGGKYTTSFLWEEQKLALELIEIPDETTVQGEVEEANMVEVDEVETNELSSIEIDAFVVEDK